MSHTYRTLAAAKVAVEAIGVDIARGGLPPRFSPFVFAFTGDGNVSQGAQEIFTQLPHRMIKAADLKALVESRGANGNNEPPCPCQGGSPTLTKDRLVQTPVPPRPAADYDPRQVYGVLINEEEYIRPRQGSGPLEDRSDYRKNPHKYRSVFHENVRRAR